MVRPYIVLCFYYNNQEHFAKIVSKFESIKAEYEKDVIVYHTYPSRFSKKEFIIQPIIDEFTKHFKTHVSYFCDDGTANIALLADDARKRGAKVYVIGDENEGMMGIEQDEYIKSGLQIIKVGLSKNQTIDN